MEKEYKNQQKTYYIISLLLICGIIYFICYQVFHLKFFFPGSICLFHDIIHLYCPGCGGTRAVNALLHLNFVDSFLFHPIVPYGFFVFLYYYIGATYTFIIKKNGRLYYRLPALLLWIALFIVAANFILRNILLVFFGIDPLHDLIFYYKPL